MGQDDQLQEIEEVCKEIIDRFPKFVELHRINAGAALGFLMGQVIKELGPCNPKLVSMTLKRMMLEA